MSETMQSEELYERFLDSLDESHGSLPDPLLESSAENLRPNSERNLPSTPNLKIVKRSLKTYGD
jgi:hypothetical protein